MPLHSLPSPGNLSARTMQRRRISVRPECSQAASDWNALRLGRSPGMPKELIFKVLASCHKHTARLTPQAQSQIEAIRGRQAGPRTNEDRAYEAVQGESVRDAWRKAMANRRNANWNRMANVPSRYEIKSVGQQVADEAKAKATAQRADHGDLRHKAAEAGRQLTRYLDEKGRIKPGTSKAAVRLALDRFSSVLDRVKGNRSQAISDAVRLAAYVRKQVGQSDAIRSKPVHLTRSIDSPTGNLRSSSRTTGLSKVSAIAGRIGPQLPVHEQAQEHRQRARLASDRVTAVLAKAKKAYQRSRANARRALKVGNESLARKHVERAVVRERRLERAISLRNLGF